MYHKCVRKYHDKCAGSTVLNPSDFPDHAGRILNWPGCNFWDAGRRVAVITSDAGDRAYREFGYFTIPASGAIELKFIEREFSAHWESL